MREHSTWFERVTDETADEVEVFYTISDFDPGVSSGPAESCYPAEGGEVEITKVLLNGKEIDWTSEEDEEWSNKIFNEHDFSDDYGYDD